MFDYEIKLMKCFAGSFINECGEFIADRRSNTYFTLGNCKGEAEVKCKVLEYLSRAAHKSEPFRRACDNNTFHAFISNGANAYLGTNFNSQQWKAIYIKLGNGINRPLCQKFIESGYDMNILEGAE